MLLSVDTSFQTGGLALFDKKKLIYETSWDKNVSHSEILTVKFLELLNKAGIESDSITEVLCANGPGSFTGLRVGINFAKSIAYTNKINLILSSSFRSVFDLEVLKNQPGTHNLVLLNAYKNQVFRADYIFSDGELSETLFETTLVPSQLEIDSKKFFAWGDGFDVYKNELPEPVKTNAMSPELNNFNPAIRHAILYLHYDHCLKFLKTDPLMAEPLYLKKSEAEENLVRGVLKKHTQRKL